jgi:hypothetical protein
MSDYATKVGPEVSAAFTRPPALQKSIALPILLAIHLCNAESGKMADAAGWRRLIFRTAHADCNFVYAQESGDFNQSDYRRQYTPIFYARQVGSRDPGRSRRCKGGLGHSASQAHFLNEPAKCLAHKEQTLRIAASKWGWQEQFDIAYSQGVVATAAFAVPAPAPAIELGQLADRTDDGIDWLER